MKCGEFKQWLVEKDLADETVSADAKLHLDDCAACKKLFDLDARLEGLVSEGLSEEADLPEGLIDKVEFNLEHLDRAAGSRMSWKSFSKFLVPVAASAAMLIIFVYPTTGRLKSLDEIGRLAVNNHLSHLAVEFTAGEVEDVSGWFSSKVGYTVTMPDLKEMDLTFIGGRKCNIGREDVAYLFYKDNSKNKRVSVFAIDLSDIGFDMDEHSTYQLSVKSKDVTFWKAGNVAYAMVE